MTIVRQIIGAFMAVSLVWVGAAAPVHAHTHQLGDHHSADTHVVSVNLDHGFSHADGPGHDHQGAGTSPFDEQVPHEHEKGIFHVHVMTFVALAAESLALVEALAETSVDLPFLTVPLHTRSVMPDDRPPRSFL